MIERQYGRLAVTPGALTMPLASEELATFTTDGMLAKRGFVPRDLIQRATSLIADWWPTGSFQRKIIDLRRLLWSDASTMIIYGGHAKIVSRAVTCVNVDIR